MYLFGIMQTIKIAMGYFLGIIFLPSLILGKRFKSEPATKRLMMYLVFGNIHLSTLVFGLAYFNRFSRFSLILSLLLTSVVLYVLVHQKELVKKIVKAKTQAREILLGEYGISLLMGRVLKNSLNYLKKLYNELIRENKIEWLIFLLIISYSVYQYGINSIELTTYIAPDEEIHLYWIQSLLQGNIYPSGVYPHVFHTILAALIKLFQYDPTQVILYFSMLSTILVMGMLYLGLRKLFTSKYAALFGFMLYTILDIYIQSTTYRFQFSIPQEYAMFLLMPLAVFLFDYINKQNLSDLIFFGLSLSLIIGIHFYTGAIAVILSMAIGVTYFYKIIKEKMLIKLVFCGFLSVILALTPLGIGLAKGYELEQSFTWGAEVIKGDIYTKTSEGILKEDVNVEETGTPTFNQFLRGAKMDVEKYVVHDVKVIYFILASISLTLFYHILAHLYRKGDSEGKYQVAFAINSLLLLALILLKALNLPTLMEPKRVSIYFVYFSAIFLGMPLEMISRFIRKTPLEKYQVPLFLGVILSSFLLIFKNDFIRPLSPFYYFQTTGTTRSNMQIIEEYEDYTWTAVSPVNNISQVMGNGYHYELSEFILAQESWTPKQVIHIPTEYVFLYVEKMPIIKYGFEYTRENPLLKNRLIITKEDAMQDLSESTQENYYYIQERKILMAKAYDWAEKYKEYFPKEIEVYYEDPELVVYRIKQNTNALNNLSIESKTNHR